MNRERQCWCGNAELLPFTDHYLRCPVCETLVCLQTITPADTNIQSDEQGYYARDYWLQHQEALGHPDIYARARMDLQDRCVYWLREMLKYSLPPAKILEIGSAHGGLVALLRLAGFDASGLEISPWVVEFSKNAFRIPVIQGRLENQNLRSSSMDAVVLMDVLEHFAEPQSSLAIAATSLVQNGILVIQTPCYPGGLSFESLSESESPFLRMLIPQEHIFLFSQQSVQILLHHLGFPYIHFARALYEGQDLFLFASREPLKENPPDLVDQHLLAQPGGRFAQAMIDLYTTLEQANADRAARLEQIITLTEMVHQTQAELSASQDAMRRKFGILYTGPRWVAKRLDNSAKKNH